MQHDVAAGEVGFGVAVRGWATRQANDPGGVDGPLVHCLGDHGGELRRGQLREAGLDGGEIEQDQGGLRRSRHGQGAHGGVIAREQGRGVACDGVRHGQSVRADGQQARAEWGHGT